MERDGNDVQVRVTITIETVQVDDHFQPVEGTELGRKVGNKILIGRHYPDESVPVIIQHCLREAVTAAEHEVRVYWP